MPKREWHSAFDMSCGVGYVTWEDWLIITIVYFNWRLITLQYCGGFCIHWLESAMGVHVFPILKPPPSSFPIPSLGGFPVYQDECPVSCIEVWLVIYFAYSNTQVSMLISQIIPPSHSTTKSKVLFLYVSLLLSRICDHHNHLSKFHIYALIHCIDIFLSDLLHSVK